ncbi:MAG: hypothetical protein ACTSVI_03310 [Promethearchaeota archaeon]
MLEIIIQLFPIFMFFLGAMASLVLDLKKRNSRILLILVPVISMVYSFIQLLDSESINAMNYSIRTNGLIFSMVNLAFMIIVLIGNIGDFTDDAMEKFHHMLSFLTMGCLMAFIFSDNLFIIGMTMLLSQLFIAILKYISQPENKRMFNVMISVMVIGFILYMAGTLILLQVENPGEMTLTYFLNQEKVDPLPAMLIYLGFSSTGSAIPAGYFMLKNVHEQSHFSVNMLHLIFTGTFFWKMLEFNLNLNFLQEIMPMIDFLFGVGGITLGVILILKNFVFKPDNKISSLLSASILNDVGLIFLLFGILKSLLYQDSMNMANIVQWTIILEILIMITTKLALILSIKNIKIIFNTEYIEEMGGIKLSRPITLLGQVFGVFGTPLLGIFILDSIHVIFNEIGNELIEVISFFMIMFVLMFNSTWGTISIMRVFGGKEIPVAVKSRISINLNSEEGIILISIASTIFIFMILAFAPSLNFLAIMGF